MSKFTWSKRTYPVVTAALMVVASSPAWAQDGPVIDFYTNSPCLVGDTGVIELATEELLENVTVDLRSGSSRWDFDFAQLGRGHSASLEVELPLGQHTIEASVHGDRAEGGTFSVTFSIPFEVSEGLMVEVPLDQVDVAARELVLILNRPAAFVEYEVTSDAGRSLGHGRVDFSGEAPGTRLSVNWTQSADNVLRILLRVHDTDGFWSEIELIPWSVDIPHEEVHFASGSADIAADEAYKVDDAFEALMAVVDQYGGYVEVQLYIAGYTDTVGSSGDNQTLSERRARSIAEAFRDRGFSFPIFYQGFGEEVLAVPTADSTDEVRNRRALYVLAAQAPLPSPQLPSDRWRTID